LSDKRFIPRNVDSRIIILNIPLKKFLLFAPISICMIVLIIYLISKGGPPILLIPFSLVMGLTYFIFAEMNYKESGIDIIKNVIKYKIEGNKQFFRGEEK